ncbi:MAG TPA: hypothetical protein VFY06_04395 [Verrucomicrobiae bacterium]|nr:hypothetical protein [Verrucomicrobiae bacterium]
MKNWLLLFVYHLLVGGILLAQATYADSAVSLDNSAPSFTAEGFVSVETFHYPSTNYFTRLEGKYLFSYSNSIWRIQCQYGDEDIPKSVLRSDSKATFARAVDVRRIPEGVRQIIIYNTASNSVGKRSDEGMLFATTESIPYPSPRQQELFTPWLSLCPNPELPLIDSNHINVSFLPEQLNVSNNRGEYRLSFIPTSKYFLSSLYITNNGILLMSDGSYVRYGGPYTNGFLQLAYTVTDTTNIDGISFPLSATLQQFLPVPHAQSAEVLFLCDVCRLKITSIAMPKQENDFIPIPETIVALDSRPTGLVHGVTINYSISNDDWPMLSNAAFARFVNVYRHMPLNYAAGNSEKSRNRHIILVAIVLVTVTPLIILLWRYWKKRTTQKKKEINK